MTRRTGLASIVGCVALLSACGPRVLIVTGTTLGLKASPGEPNGGRPPQVTFGYKRGETAIVPTGRSVAKSGCTDGPDADAYSTLASFFFRTRWWGETRLASFVATGFAARTLGRPDELAVEPTARRVPGKTYKNSFADAFRSAAKRPDSPAEKEKTQ